jgi:transcription antitermination protein NusB
MTDTYPDIPPSQIDSNDAPARYKSARAHARALALQGLYALFVAGNDSVLVRLEIERGDEFKRVDKEHFRALWAGIVPELAALEAVFLPHLDRPMAELSPIERAVLSLSTWELRSRIDIPYRVVINEGVELAKRFGGTDGHKYVNGVLDKLAPVLRPDEWAARNG